IEVKYRGYPIRDILHINSHLLPNISPRMLNHFEIHKCKTIKVSSVSAENFIKYGKEILFKEMIVSVDLEKKSITWKVIGVNMLELYDSFIIITSSEYHWTTVTLMYEKKIEDIIEPLTLLGIFLIGLNDLECHHLK
ncbi:hypothetical protein EJD97_023297, partial [Solanum chilense]